MKSWQKLLASTGFETTIWPEHALSRGAAPKSLKASFGLEQTMAKHARRRVAEEAARYMVDGLENEYLDAKERAIHKLGLSTTSYLPSNRTIKNCIARITKDELGPDEVKKRVREMREIAEQIMTAIDDYDPFLIGSTLTGEIRSSSDIDLHAYSDNYEEITDRLFHYGYEEIDEELVENLKGTFVHLKWYEQNYPVEITVYPWSWRDVILLSSVTGKPMKRADHSAVRHLVNCGKKEP